MKSLYLSLFFSLFFLSSAAHSAEKTCTCKCVVKEDEGYSTRTATGKDREEAGENLKKALKKQKCELSPDCTGNC